MKTAIPSTIEVRAALEKLSHADVTSLAVRAKVPFTTLWKIRSGETADPRLETVRRFMPLLGRKG